MTRRSPTALPTTTASNPIPVDHEAITDTVARILAPRAGLPDPEMVEEWLELLRGHIALLVPVVEDRCAPGWQEVVAEVRAELDKGPGNHRAAACVHAQVLARCTRQLLGMALEQPGAGQ
ncbi:DUF6415 family natural product biosynthesis protein [Streptomyces sp. CBMA152]|uniref:DUF6415 family natural product biosynthesis protein n=1 Tax=Streptomyces sp. CBMA152 TaxID=1896312 RepID=UPI00166048C2|nr:DUF6415 family natural product biosynthesis protein [Streptomyces sp. CBMA152]MBD0744953.1 hypothetical protein [Streptomyces sp. CBMA152]